MKSKDLLEKIELADDKYINSTADYKKKNRAAVNRIISIAAAALLVAASIPGAVYIITSINRKIDPAAPVVTDGGSTVVYSTDTDTEGTGAVTVTEYHDTDTEPVQEYNDIDRFLLGLSGRVLDDTEKEQLISGLEQKGCQDDYFTYCVLMLKDGKRDQELLNCAGHFINIFARYYPDLYMCNDTIMNNVITIVGEPDPGSDSYGTYYTDWYDYLIKRLDLYASGITEERAREFDYFYKLMTLNGYTEWNHEITPAQAVEESLRSLFEVYNAVYSGIPMPYTGIEPVSAPYEKELQEKIKSFWGDEERDFVKSSVTLSEYKKKLKNSTQSYIDLYVDDTKYFITVGETVYLTTAKDTDADADRYEFVEITKINEPEATMRSVYGDAKVLHNGAEESFHYWFNDAYQVSYSKCDNGRFELDEHIIVFRGEKTVLYAIDRIIETNSFPDVAYMCCSQLKETTVSYVASRYFGETDEKVRAALSALLNQCARRDEFSYYDLLGNETADSFSYAEDGTYIFNGNYVKERSAWIDKFTEAVKEEVKNRYREEIEDYFPTIYMFLSDIGFDGYKPGELDLALRSRKVINEALTLANALLRGLGRYDETSVIYGNKETGSLEYPESVAKIIENNGIEYWEGISTQAQGFKTADEWKQYYKKILPDDVVEGAIRNTGRFIIADGIVYTSSYGGESYYEIDILNVRKTGEKNGHAILATDVRIPLGMSYYTQQVTFEVVEENGEIRIVGGTFIDIFLKDGATDGKAALTVYELIRAQEILYDGNVNFTSFQGYENFIKVINDKSELEEYIKFVSKDEPVPDVPDELYPLYVYVGWSSKTSWEWTLEKMLPEGYYDIMITNNKNVVPMKYSYLLISANVDKKTTPLIGSADKITVTDVYNSMKVMSRDGDKITVSLDFVREENGKSKNVTYTFELEKTAGLYLMLTGGTFDSEVLLEK